MWCRKKRQSSPKENKKMVNSEIRSICLYHFHCLLPSLPFNRSICRCAKIDAVTRYFSSFFAPSLLQPVKGIRIREKKEKCTHKNFDYHLNVCCKRLSMICLRLASRVRTSSPGRLRHWHTCACGSWPLMENNLIAEVSVLRVINGICISNAMINRTFVSTFLFSEEKKKQNVETMVSALTLLLWPSYATWEMIIMCDRVSVCMFVWDGGLDLYWSIHDCHQLHTIHTLVHLEVIRYRLWNWWDWCFWVRRNTTSRCFVHNGCCRCCQWWCGNERVDNYSVISQVHTSESMMRQG